MRHSPSHRLLPCAAWIAALCFLPACRTSGLTDQLRPPEYRPSGETKCRVSKSQDNPLVVEWPSTDRAALEASLKRGPVAVRYTGCEMQVLRECRLQGKYRYVSITPKQDVVTIRDEDQLYASLPVGAPLLEARLKTSGQLNVDTTLVGRFELEDPSISGEATGNCGGATHLVSGVTVGAFTFSAGAQLEAEVGASWVASGKTAGARETLTRDGDAAACQQASAAGSPPDRCGAIVRIEVSKIPANVVLPSVAAAPTPVAPSSNAAPAWLLAGIGVVGLGVGAGYGLRAMSQSHDADQYCDGRACRDQRGIDLRNQATESATVSTVSFGLGLLAIGTGVWLGVSSPDRSSKEATARSRTAPEVKVGLGSLQVGGAW